MEHVSFRRKIFIVLIVALAFASGTSLGWYARGGELPVGGMPTVAAVNQLVAAPIETEAEPTASMPATEPAPTSTAAPTVAQPTIPTSTSTATPTPHKEEWEIDNCPLNSMGGPVTCWDIVVEEGGEAARLYWVGPCLDPDSLRLSKKVHGQVYPDLLPEEWAYKFVPNKCDRQSDQPSRNYLLVRTFAGPGEYALTFEPVGSNSVYFEFFEWPDAPAAIETTPAATATPDMPAGAMAETETSTPFVMEPRVQSSTPLRGFAASPTEDLHSTPGDAAKWLGTLWFASPVYIWECGVELNYPEGTYLSLVSHEGDGGVKVGWIATASYTDRHPCSFYSAPGVGALVNYLVATGLYGDEEEIRGLPGLQYDPYGGVNDLD